VLPSGQPPSERYLDAVAPAGLRPRSEFLRLTPLWHIWGLTSDPEQARRLVAAHGAGASAASPGEPARGKIDAHVAAVIARYTLLRNPSSVYDERGILRTYLGRQGLVG